MNRRMLFIVLFLLVVLSTASVWVVQQRLQGQVNGPCTNKPNGIACTAADGTTGICSAGGCMPIRKCPAFDRPEQCGNAENPALCCATGECQIYREDAQAEVKFFCCPNNFDINKIQCPSQPLYSGAGGSCAGKDCRKPGSCTTFSFRHQCARCDLIGTDFSKVNPPFTADERSKCECDKKEIDSSNSADIPFCTFHPKTEKWYRTLPMRCHQGSGIAANAVCVPMRSAGDIAGGPGGGPGGIEGGGPGGDTGAMNGGGDSGGGNPGGGPGITPDRWDAGGGSSTASVDPCLIPPFLAGCPSSASAGSSTGNSNASSGASQPGSSQGNSSGGSSQGNSSGSSQGSSQRNSSTGGNSSGGTGGSTGGNTGGSTAGGGSSGASNTSKNSNVSSQAQSSSASKIVSSATSSLTCLGGDTCIPLTECIGKGILKSPGRCSAVEQNKWCCNIQISSTSSVTSSTSSTITCLGDDKCIPLTECTSKGILKSPGRCSTVEQNKWCCHIQTSSTPSSVSSKSSTPSSQSSASSSSKTSTSSSLGSSKSSISSGSSASSASPQSSQLSSSVRSSLSSLSLASSKSSSSLAPQSSQKSDVGSTSSTTYAYSSRSVSLCYNDYECPDGLCLNGLCVPGCKQNTDCFSGLCVNGYCSDLPSIPTITPNEYIQIANTFPDDTSICLTDTDCAQGERCVLNRCLIFTQLAALPAFCGNARIEAGETCDIGIGNADKPNAYCRSDCTLGGCSDGILDTPLEQCDDGNSINGDGCSAVCSLERTAPTTLPAQIIELPFESEPQSSASFQEEYVVPFDEPTIINKSPPPSTPDSGPASLAIMLAGGAAGWLYKRRR